jgi:CheY-like chemotaxis protein
VLFTGDIDHADFRDVADLLRADTDSWTSNASPELIVVAHSRPGSTGWERLESLRRKSPLAGIVVIAGSWCEGEPRTGRPWPGAHRLYWYEFPAWWRRQLALRAAGYCPGWCRPEEQRGPLDAASRHVLPGAPGSILLSADFSANDALADILQRAGYVAIRIQGSFSRSFRVRAAIWDGGQLSKKEESELSQLCAALSADRTPVVAMLDFPRYDRVQSAIKIGASAVLGKPCQNSDLLATIESVIAPASLPVAA